MSAANGGMDGITWDETRTRLAAQGRYPLYNERSELVGTIDEDKRIRDNSGRFVAADYDERRALLASCLMVTYGWKPIRP